MKNNRYVKFLVWALALTLTLTLAGCTNNEVEPSPQNNGVKVEEKATFDVENAIEVALNSAGVKKEDATFKTAKIDNDDGISYFDIEFFANGVSYEFEIDREGNVIKQEKNDEEVVKKEAYANENTSKAENGYISVDEAKKYALEHAGLTSTNVKFQKAKFDGDDLLKHYDIEFVSNGYEYDYEINASNGAVIDFEKEKETKETASQQENTTYISKEKAKSIALKNAGVNEADAIALKVELDKDDGIAHYEVEFKSGGYEYDYEINAKTGAIIAKDKERD